MAKKETKGGAKVGTEKKVKKSDVEEVVVDQAYIEAHPDLEAEGVKVGDTIEVSVAPKETSKGLDLDGEVSILKGSEYIRTYPEGNEENVKSLLSKDSKYVAVEAESIVEITVTWRESIKRESENNPGRMTDTGKMETKSVTFSEKTNGENFKAEARSLANQSPRRSCTARLG